MASKIKPIGAYRPRVEQGNTVQRPELIRVLSRSTGLVEGSIDQVIKELRDQIIELPMRPTFPWMARSTCNTVRTPLSATA